MVENPYDPRTAEISGVKTRATRALVWSGIVCLGLAALCLFATVVGMVLTFESIAKSSSNVKPSDLARGLNFSLLPLVAGVPLVLLGIILTVAGLIRRQPVSKS